MAKAGRPPSFAKISKGRLFSLSLSSFDAIQDDPESNRTGRRLKAVATAIQGSQQPHISSFTFDSLMIWQPHCI